MATFDGLNQTQINSLTADIDAARQLAMACMSSMTLSAIAATQPGGGRGYNYAIRPAVGRLLNEAFGIDATNPDPAQVDQVKNMFGAFAGRMQNTTFKLAPGAGNPAVLEFDAFVDRNVANTIFVRAAYFLKAAPERAITLIHEYVHLRFQNNPGDGHPGGAVLMFTRGNIGIPFASAVLNPYCYDYYARFVRMV